MRHLVQPSRSILLFALLAVCWCVSACGDDPVEPGDVERGRRVAMTKCTFCHHIDGQGGMIGPPMEKSVQLAAEVVRGYEKRVAELRERFPKVYAESQATIDAVLAEKDYAKRYEKWAAAYLKDTKFDNPMTKMGNVLIDEQQRADVVAWLMTRRPSE